MFLRLASAVAIFTGFLYGCDWVVLPAPEAKRSSGLVFRGTVSAFRDLGDGRRIVVFRVSRVWKGQLGQEFEMPAEEGDWCHAFRPTLLKIGNELVVYASKIADGKGTEYFPLPCNTALASEAGVVRAIGPGRQPRGK
jgi:hypothetical protein